MSSREVYRVWCEDCDLHKTFDPENPPNLLIDYWGDRDKAIKDWDPKSAAKGVRDNHHASEFRDYEQGLRHRVHMERVEAKEEEEL